MIFCLMIVNIFVFLDMKKDDSLIEINEEREEKPSNFKKFGTVLIVGFVILGMSAFGLLDFLGGGSDYVVKVGDKKVTPQAFSKFLDSQRKQYIFRFGSGIIETLLNKKEFVLITVNGVADGLLISKALEDEGIVVNKDTVNYYILNSPTFKTADNKFDALYFKTYLAQMGISEEDYITEQISVIKSKFLLEFLSLSEISFQENLVKTLIASEKQTREIFVKRIPISENNIGEIPEKEVLQYYVKNKGNFVKPEKKTVMIGKIDETLFDNTPISEKELVSEYNRQYLYKNQKISFYKLSFPSLSEAQFAENLIKNEGLAFTDVAQETLKLKASDIYFKNIPFSDLSSEFFENLSSLNKFEMSPIFYANESYNILKVDNISKSNVPSFESVKGKILASMKKLNRCPEIEKMAEKVASELDSGELIENQLKFAKLQKVVISGQEKSTLPAILESSIISDSDTSYGKVIKTKPCEYYAYHITNIEPQTFKQVEEVSDEIISEIKKSKIKEAALLKANNQVEKFQTANFPEDEKIILTRSGNNLFSSEVMKQIFASEEGEIMLPILSASEKDFLIIKISKINKFDETKIKASEISSTLKQIRENQKDELLQAYLTKLREKYKVKINYSYLQFNE